MNAKTTIRKLLFIGLWLCIGAGMFTLLLAAISNKKKGTCSDYSIALQSESNRHFINEKDIVQLLEKKTGGKMEGQQISSFPLHKLEEVLKQNPWINNAELYFDNKNVLHVSIKEKEPIGRIFTTTGNSFYIDESGSRMPLSDQQSARVPMFTGFPEAGKLTSGDSVLLEEVTKTAAFIFKNPFWMSQVAQIDISADDAFEMIPVVGNHSVKLGNGENIENKFSRLFIFYRQVLSKAGFDKYKLIDVRFNGQVVASNEAASINIDPVQYRKRVEQLIRESNETINEVLQKIPAVTGKYNLSSDSATAPVPELMEIENIQKPVKQAAKNVSNPNPVKSFSPAKTEERKEQQKEIKTPVKQEKKIPKAVMTKKVKVEEDNRGYN